MPYELEGRWCGEPGCGGELRHRRRRTATGIVTYLVCQFCGARTPVLAYDMATGEHTDLLATARKS